LPDQEDLQAKARLLLQRERELFDLRAKFEQLAVWLSVGQTLPELFIERGRTLPHLFDRVRKLFIAKLRLQRVCWFELADEELRPLSPAGDLRRLSAPAQACLAGQPHGVCNEPSSAPALAEALGLYRFMWIRIERARDLPILLVAGFDATKAVFQSPFGDADAAQFGNAARQVEALLANYLLVGELEREKTHLEHAITTLEQRDRELSTATEELLVANDTLEQRVRERTAALASKNTELRLVLDNVDQGLIIVDLHGRMALERSSAVERWFGAAADVPLFEYLAADRRFADLLDLGLEALREDIMPREVSLGQFPETLQLGARHFHCRYLPIEEEGQWVSLLLVIDDVTEQLKRAREEAEQRELVAACTALMRDRAGFFRFFEEVERMLAELCATTSDERRMQLLHTLKGNAATLGLRVVAELCHAAESARERQGGVTPESIEPLTARWAAVAGELRTLAPAGLEKLLELSDLELGRLKERARSGATALQIVQDLEHLRWEPVARTLDRIGQQARALALRMGKGALDVQVDTDSARLDPERWAPLWSALVHVVRNAVDHGLEPPREREAVGKPARGRIRLSAHRVSEGYRLELSDDGRGVDWVRVQNLCLARGRPAASRADLVNALLSTGFSTRSDVTELSGRGVGLAAVAEAVRALSGAISLESDAGSGTRWVFTFPQVVAGQ
jgi:two-component system chemotaxis sensor kinase CheA